MTRFTGCPPFSEAPADILIRTAPLNWGEKLRDQAIQANALFEEDEDKLIAAVEGGKATVVVPADDPDCPQSVLGSIFSEVVSIPNQGRAGHLSAQSVMARRLFGLNLARTAQHYHIAPALIAVEATYQALEDGIVQPVYAGVPPENIPVERALSRAGFWVSNPECAVIALRLGPNLFSKFLTARAPASSAWRVAVLENEGLIQAAELLADLTLNGIRLGTGELLAIWDCAEGRNSVLNLAIAVGRDYPGVRQEVALNQYEPMSA